MDNGILTIQLAIYLFIFFVLPGYLFLRIWGMPIRLTFYSILPLSFSVSFALFFPLTLIMYFIKAPLYILPVISMLLSIILLVFIIINKRFVVLKINEPLNKHVIIGALAIILVAASITSVIGTNEDGDSLYHLTFVRKLTENAVASPYDAMFRVNEIPATYGYNTWYLQIASVFALTKTDVGQAWSAVSTLLCILALLSLGAITEKIFKSQRLPIIAMSFFVLLQGLPNNFFEMQLLPYPDQIARLILLPCLLFIFFEYLNTQRKKILLVGVLLLGAATFTHLYTPVIFGVFVAFYILFLAATQDYRSLKSALIFFVYAFLISGILILIKGSLVSSFITSLDPIKTLRSDGVWITESLFVISPKQVFSSFHYTLLTVFLVSVFFLFLKKSSFIKSTWFGYTFCFAIAPIIILLNPYFATYGSELITYTYVHRLWNIVPFPIISAALMFLFWRFLQLLIHNKPRFRFVSVTTIVVVFCFLSALLIKQNFRGLHWNFRAEAREKSEAYFEGNPVDTSKMLTYIKNNISPGSIILSDPWTSYRIVSSANLYAVTSLWQHFSPVVDRVAYTETANFMLTSPDIGSSIQKMAQLDVQYIVVNKPYASYKSYFALEERLMNFPEIFVPLFSNSSYSVWEVRSSSKYLDQARERLMQIVNRNMGLPTTMSIIDASKKLINLDSRDDHNIKQFEALRALYNRNTGESLNIASFDSGVLIEETSDFFAYPNDVSAIIDGVDAGENDYAAAVANTTPNWFILDFQKQRKISGYSIQWLAAATSGNSWMVEGFFDGSWHLVDRVENWPKNNFYRFDIVDPLTIQKIKVTIFDSKEQNRALIKNLSIF